MTTRYSEHPSMFRSHPIGFVLALILIPAYGIGVVIFVLWYLQSKATKLVITDAEILLERGLLSKERIEVNMASVRSTTVNQSFVNRLMGVGSVKIYTAGDAPEIMVSGMPDPNRIRELIKGQVSG